MRLRQPYIDLIGIWKGFGYPDRRNFQWDSKARIRIWNGNNCHFVVFSDLDEPDSGTSITNSSENLATFIRAITLLSASAKLITGKKKSLLLLIPGTGKNTSLLAGSISSEKRRKL
jgi:hypothetical protein